MCHLRWTLHVIITQKVFYIISYLQFLYIFYAIFIRPRCTRLGRRKSICIPNFDEIFQSSIDIKLLPVSDNGRSPYCNLTSSFDFDLQCMCNYSHVILHPPAKFRSNQTSIGGLLTTYSRGGHRVGNLLPSSGLVTAFVQNGKNPFAYQISIRYLNLLLRYYYFRFR